MFPSLRTWSTERELVLDLPAPSQDGGAPSVPTPVDLRVRFEFESLVTASLPEQI